MMTAMSRVDNTREWCYDALLFATALSISCGAPCGLHLEGQGRTFDQAYVGLNFDTRSARLAQQDSVEERRFGIKISSVFAVISMFQRSRAWDQVNEC